MFAGPMVTQFHVFGNWSCEVFDTQTAWIGKVPFDKGAEIAPSQPCQTLLTGPIGGHLMIEIEPVNVQRPLHDNTHSSQDLRCRGLRGSRIRTDWTTETCGCVRQFASLDARSRVPFVHYR